MREDRRVDVMTMHVEFHCGLNHCDKARRDNANREERVEREHRIPAAAKGHAGEGRYEREQDPRQHQARRRISPSLADRDAKGEKSHAEHPAAHDAAGVTARNKEIKEADPDQNDRSDEHDAAKERAEQLMTQWLQAQEELEAAVAES